MANVNDKERYNAEEVLEEIIYLTHYGHDIAEFGRSVASVLYEKGCIDEAIYEILMGK